MTLALALSTPCIASANGRFPRAERLLEDPQDPNHLVLAATYGLLTTQDHGKSWFHVCEAAFAEPGGQTDPVAALTTDGSLLISIFSSLSRSHDGACDFRKMLGGDPSQAVPDFTVDSQGAVLAVRVTTASGTSTNQLQESLDGGQHYHPLGPALPDSIRLVATIDVAPSDPKRLYVSGLGLNGVGVLLRSDDRGATFTTLPLPTDPKNDEVPFIAAVDPKNRDALYVRTDVWKYDESEGVAYAADALFYSTDAGEKFSELIRTGGKLFGFALSPDGQDLLVGYGDPVEGGGRVTDPDALGVYRAPTATNIFTKVLASPVSCLTWTEAGVYACTAQAELGFALGLAAPASLGPESVTRFLPLLSLIDVKGPLSCPACASGARCSEFWEATCSAWGRADCTAPVAANGVAAACPAGEAAGAGGAMDAPHGTGGTSANVAGNAAGGTPSPNGGAPAVTPKVASNEAETSGCGCRAAGSAPTSGLATVALVALGLLARRRGALLLLSALALFGCGNNGDTPRAATPDDGTDCSGDFDKFEPGMTIEALPGMLTVELARADPSPPVVRSENVWWLKLSDADGTALSGAEVVASPYMPKHQHGSAEVVVEEQGEGEYRLSPIELIMPGVWEVPLSITPAGGVASEAIFRFCIAER